MAIPHDVQIKIMRLVADTYSDPHLEFYHRVWDAITNNVAELETLDAIALQ